MALRAFITVLSSRPFITFFPFLFVYIAVFLLTYDEGECLIVDGREYLQKSSNLLDGYYSPSDPAKISLEHGPGYPIFLIPFVAFNIPHIIICLFNTVFHYLAVVFLYKSLRLCNCRPLLCLAGAMFLACYYPAFIFFKFVCRENMAVFLSSLLLFVSAYSFNRRTLSSIIIAGFVLSCLLLTKVMFAYVLLGISIVFAVLFVLNRQARVHTRLFLGMCGCAWLFVAPYLVYTYSVTDKFFYLSTSGGVVLYSMSTLHPEEFGDSFTMCDTTIIDNDLKARQKKMYANHKSDIDYFYSSGLDPVERDEAYKRRALQNIRENPLKYAKNCMANFSRLWFETPDSYFPQQYKVVIYFPVHSVLLVLIVLSMIVLVLNYRSMSCHALFVMLLLVLYLGGSTLVSAYIRMLFLAVPFMLFLIGYTFERFISLRIATDFHKRKMPL